MSVPALPFAPDSLIVVNELRKSFKLGFARRRTFEALQGISLSVARGSATGFLGPNGAGKTTTIKILTGLIFPDSGSALVLGEQPDQPDIRRRIGYLPENPSFHDHLSGIEVLDFTCQLQGVPHQQRARRIGEVLEQVKLSHAGNMQVRRYSKGMVQRLGIAQALIHEPELLILDEPMSGLDPVGRREVRDLILELRKAGKTIFFSTHIIADVEDVCDRVSILVKGKVVRDGPVGELLGAQAGEMEIVATNVPDSFPGRTDHSASQMPLFRAANRDEARQVVEKLWQAGAQVVSMNVRRYRLEDVFMEALREKGGPSVERPAGES